MTIEPPSDEVEGEDDELLLGLSTRARAHEAQREASPWAALARGELDAKDARARAAAEGMDGGELDRAAAYFTPFDADERGALVDDLLAGLGKGSDVADDGEEADEPVSIDRAREAKAKADPEPAANDGGGSASWWVPAGMIAAAAAAIVLWVVWPPSAGLDGGEGEGPGAEGGELVAVAEPVPKFALETDGGLASLRGSEDGGGEDEAPRYRRDTRFEWVLRPASAVEGELDLRAFVFVADSPGLPLDLDGLSKISGSGSIRIAGTIGELDLEPGRYTIALVVGRPGSLPEQAPPPGDDEGEWRVSMVSIVIED